MAKLMQKKVEGSTLIEVLIAMVIIMVVFSIAIGLFGNVLNGGVSFKKVQVQNQMNVLGKAVTEKGYVETQHLLIDSVDYDLLADTSGMAGISRLQIKASQHGRSLGILKCLYKTKNEIKKD